MTAWKRAGKSLGGVAASVILEQIGEKRGKKPIFRTKQTLQDRRGSMDSAIFLALGIFPHSDSLRMTLSLRPHSGCFFPQERKYLSFFHFLSLYNYPYGVVRG